MCRRHEIGVRGETLEPAIGRSPWLKASNVGDIARANDAEP
jgi:hypothetical protein